ncbi:hypothetical protein V8C86DRAFT_1823503 [Haematococcus lacustris]
MNVQMFNTRCLSVVLLASALQLNHTAAIAVNGATGQLFSGERFRRYSEPASSCPVRDDGAVNGGLHGLISLSTLAGQACTCWAVVTTINGMTAAMQAPVKYHPSWCVVVVADVGSPHAMPPSPRLQYLTLDLQAALAQRSCFVAALPWRHYARKNVGYLWALLHNASCVFDMDDDNELHGPIPWAEALMAGSSVPPNSSTGFRLLLLPQHKGRVLNPYPLFQPSHLPLWPRGFPLAAVKDPEAYASLTAARSLRWDAFSNPASAGHGARGVVGVVQILAQHDPDVDAVYRMTLPLPVTFHTSAGVRMNHLSLLLLPPRCLAPLNAQATLFLQPTLWALLLPASVHGRVTDIWRGYLAQRLMWEVRGLRTAFASPWVTHVRSSYHISTRGLEKEAGENVPRSHVADMVAEQDLYYRAGQLVSFLSSWQCADVPVRHTTVRVRRRITFTAGQQPASLSECVLQLWREMYERGYIEEQDVRLAQLWLLQLQQIAGYTLPARASL